MTLSVDPPPMRISTPTSDPRPFRAPCEVDGGAIWGSGVLVTIWCPTWGRLTAYLVPTRSRSGDDVGPILGRCIADLLTPPIHSLWKRERERTSSNSTVASSTEATSTPCRPKSSCNAPTRSLARTAAAEVIESPVGCPRSEWRTPRGDPHTILETRQGAALGAFYRGVIKRWPSLSVVVVPRRVQAP